MKFRKIISLSIALSFVVLAITGIVSFFKSYSREVATLHTIFGLVFTLGIGFHLFNNLKSIQKYLKGKIFPLITLIVLTLFISAYYEVKPLKNLMDFGTKLKANNEQEVIPSKYDVYNLNVAENLSLSVDLLKGKRYWHPQVVVWVEDTQGNYITTLFATKATAKGIFYGGRSKENYKEFDGNKDVVGAEFRRVDALPVWSHKRGIKYPDGLYAPTAKQPLPDGITGATPINSFRLNTSIEELAKFVIKLEINIAFDDNKYYSEFDFPDDDIFHNGTGQLGQPSLIYEAKVDMNDGLDYYLMKLAGHGHHSAQTGEIYPNLSKLTTALQIVERIVLGVKRKGGE